MSSFLLEEKYERTIFKDTLAQKRRNYSFFFLRNPARLKVTSFWFKIGNIILISCCETYCFKDPEVSRRYHNGCYLLPS